MKRWQDIKLRSKLPRWFQRFIKTQIETTDFTDFTIEYIREEHGYDGHHPALRFILWDVGDLKLINNIFEIEDIDPKLMRDIAEANPLKIEDVPYR